MAKAKKSEELVDELRDRTSFLERQLTSREEPLEAPDSPGPTRTRTDAAGGQETTGERAPWWRGMFS